MEGIGKMNSVEKVKEYLGQVMGVENRIDTKLEKIRYYRSLAERSTNIFSTEKVNGGVSARNRMEECVCKIVELEEAARDDIWELVALKAEIEGIIRKVGRAEYKQLLELRYICSKTLEQVANDMGYSCRQVVRLHRMALQSIVR